jgi:peroxiredoxin Q/BCP
MEHIKAPNFSLPDQSGNNRTLTDFSGQNILLYFYPKDMTPGCTTETIGFQENKENFEKMNTLVIGVSKDSVKSHEKFCEKHNLDIILLSDVEATLIKEYGVLQEKSMLGKKYMAISRESFLINTDGIIEKHWEKVNPAKHPQEVLDYLRSK